MTRSFLAAALLLNSLALGPGVLEAQEAPPLLHGDRLVRPGSPAEDRLRVRQILGEAPLSGFLIRSTSMLMTGAHPDGGFDFAALAPELRWVHNSELPHTFNDAALWAGKGGNLHLTAGMRARAGPVTLVLAPDWVYSENLEYQVVPYAATRTPERSRFAHPWYGQHESIDLPTRFGAESISRIGPGESSLSIGIGPIAVGAATESLWWGPGTRNALVMSSHAAGIPHLFIRTRAPIRTRLGEIHGRWIAGRLEESGFFDSNAENDKRSIGAVALSLSPAAQPDLTFGLTRAVYSTAEGGADAVGAAFDVFRNIGRPNSVGGEQRAGMNADQVFSLFARWVLPDHGFESYLEWARFEQPASLRDLLVAPNHSQGYTAGLHWARETGRAGTARIQAELTYLEPSTTFKERPFTSTYASRVVEQGYTHRGQSIGASIGPGASSQWVAADLIAPRWRIGGFAERIRWHEGALKRLEVRSILLHEISLIAGVRAGVTVGGFEIFTEYAAEGRLNYLFQNPILGLDDPEGVDLTNHSLRLTVQPTRGLRIAPPGAPSRSPSPPDPS